MALEPPEWEVMEVNETCVVAIDCAVAQHLSPYACIEYRDNSTTTPRWLDVSIKGG